jgi:hypothetical protein
MPKIYNSISQGFKSGLENSKIPFNSVQTIILQQGANVFKGLIEAISNKIFLKTHANFNHPYSQSAS